MGRASAPRQIFKSEGHRWRHIVLGTANKQADLGPANMHLKLTVPSFPPTGWPGGERALAPGLPVPGRGGRPSDLPVFGVPRCQGRHPHPSLAHLPKLIHRKRP